MNFASPLPSHCATYPEAKYVSPSAPKTRKRTSAKLNAAGAPKRPLNAFLLYRQQNYKQLVERTGVYNHSRISSMIAGAWHALSIEEKQPYIEESNEQKRQHQAQYPNYRYNPQMRGVRQKRATFGNTAEHKKIYAEIGRSTVTGADASDALRALDVLDESESRPKRRARKVTSATTAPATSVPAPSSPSSAEEWAESVVNPDCWGSPSESSSSPESSIGLITPITPNTCLEPQKPACSEPNISWAFPGCIEPGLSAPSIDAMPWEPTVTQDAPWNANDWQYSSSVADSGNPQAQAQASCLMQPPIVMPGSGGGSMHAGPSCSTDGYGAGAQSSVYNEQWMPAIPVQSWRYLPATMEPCIPLDYASFCEQLNPARYY